MDILIEGVGKQFGDTAALHPVDLAIPSGQLVALLGPSGSGKTTLLRLIAGLLPVDGGRIVFGETDATRLSLRERRVGFVFQHYALFPHLSVFENIAFGLRCKPRAQRPDKAAIQRKVDELLSLVQMSNLRDRLPDQLSGGQKQRVALARAMAIEPMATASMCGADMQRLGVSPGDVITVASRRGSVAIHLRRDDGTPAGAVFIPFAYYEAAANLLTNAALDPVGKIPEFKYCAVAVKAGGATRAAAGYGTGATA